MATQAPKTTRVSRPQMRQVHAKPCSKRQRERGRTCRTTHNSFEAGADEEREREASHSRAREAVRYKKSAMEGRRARRQTHMIPLAVPLRAIHQSCSHIRTGA